VKTAPARFAGRGPVVAIPETNVPPRRLFEEVNRTMMKWRPPKTEKPPKSIKKATRTRRSPRPKKRRRSRNPKYRAREAS